MPNLTRRHLALLAGTSAAAGVARLGRAQAAESIKLGMTTALSGPYSEFGIGLQRGMELGIAAVNANGGVGGRKLAIGQLLDDQFISDRAVQNMRRILDDRDVVGILAPSGSGPTLATVDMVVADGRPFINCQAQAPNVVYPNGPDKPRPNVFSVGVQNDVDGQFMASVLAKLYKKIGVLHESTAYGKSGGQLVMAEIAKIDKDIPLTEESYNQKEQDMTAQLLAMRRAGVEAMCVIGLGADLAVVRRNMARLNVTLPLYTFSGGITAPFLDGAGPLVVGTRGDSAAKIARQPPAPQTTAFLDAYRAKYGTDRWWGSDPDHPHPTMSTTVGSGYDAVLLLADAIKRAETTDAARMVKSLDATTDLQGAVGDYSFTPTRHHSLGPKDLSFFEYKQEAGKIMLLPVAL